MEITRDRKRGDWVVQNDPMRPKKEIELFRLSFFMAGKKELYLFQ
jgi:hypothetical protein